MKGKEGGCGVVRERVLTEETWLTHRSLKNLQASQSGISFQGTFKCISLSHFSNSALFPM